MENFRETKLGSRSQISAESSSLFDLNDEPSSSPSTMETTTENMCTEWTNEKHSLYLKSMEASFVNQLYDSMELLGWVSEKEDLSHAKQSKKTLLNSTASPGQFKVFRSGLWQKINLERSNEPRVKTRRNESTGELLSNPWIVHYRSSANKNQEVESCFVPEHGSSAGEKYDSERNKAILHGTTSSSKQLQSRDLLSSNTEVSDQNFVDDGIEEEKTRGTSSAKRVKTLLSGASGFDQVVPLRKLSAAEDKINNRQREKHL
ncbi:hypothetical protein UlMin_035063 [Ulmus minor]